jgi:HrpA-like RNA helicase
MDTTKKIENVLINSILDGNSGIKQIYRGHILVFCSEVSQINRLCEIFKSKLNPKIFKVFPLHGKLAPQ